MFKKLRIDVLALGLAFSAAALPAVAQTIPCKVVGVTDGDTLTCLTSEKKQIKVRLAQIDAPEKAQPFGQRAKQALSDLAFGQQVSLEPETTDRYGRTVAKVLRGGQDVNIEMVRRGMAWVYDQYARDPAYFAAQDDARRAGVGLWADANPVRPSEWRRGNSPAPERSGVTTASFNSPSTAKAASAEFSCGKRTCGQMASCEEARFHLNQCGVNRIDRDRDGVPCESLCM